MESIDAVIKNELTPAQRKLMMVDTNLEQRHKLTAKERALAYKIKHDCLRELGVNNPTALIAKENGENRKSVQRYLAISRLNPELLDMVDSDKLKLNVGVTIVSGSDIQLKECFKKLLNKREAEMIIQNEVVPSLAQADEQYENSQENDDMEI